MQDDISFFFRFAHNAGNLVFPGPPSVGKSHLAIAMGIEAVNAGSKVDFVNVDALVEGLKNANLKGILEKKLKFLAKYDVLILDEMGYPPFDSEGVHCFFSAVFKKVLKSSKIFTSNRS